MSCDCEPGGAIELEVVVTKMEPYRHPEFFDAGTVEWLLLLLGRHLLLLVISTG